MERRDFGLGLIGTGLAAGGMLGAGPALANKDDEGPRDILFSRVRLMIAGRQILLTWFLVQTATFLYALRLSREFQVFVEDRVDASALPLVGGLFRPTLASRLLAAQFVGNLVLYRSMLILLPGSPDFRPPARTTIAHRDESWDISERPGKAQFDGLPALAELLRMKTVGRAFADRKGLMAFVEPTAVRVPEA